MKATFRTILCAAAAVLAAVSCQKSAEVEEPIAEEKGTIDIRIGGLMGEYSQVDGTKAELVNTVRVAWKGNETVYVFDGTQCLGSLTAALENGEDRYAVLSGNITAPALGTVLTLVYSPLLSGAPTVSEGAISISLANQNGAKVPFVVFATLDYDGEAAIENAVVPFQFATSVIRVNSTGLKANTAISKATLSNVNTLCMLTLSGSAAPTVTGAENGTITRTGDTYFAAGKVNAEGEAVFQIAVPKLESATKARVLSVTQDEHDYKDWNFTQSLLGPATSVNTVCQLLAPGALPGVFSVSPTRKVHFSQGNLWADATDANNPVFYFEENQNKYVSTEKQLDKDHWGTFRWSKSVSIACTWSHTERETGTTANDIFFANASGFAVNGVTGFFSLSAEEWNYLINDRTMENTKPRYTISGFGNPTVHEIEGVFLYPDNYSGNEVSNSMTWEQINEAGIVFLPMPDPEQHFSSFDYWTSSTYGDTLASSATREGGDLEGVWFEIQPRDRNNANYVRLVTDAN